jgi:hypothetical protein
MINKTLRSIAALLLVSALFFSSGCLNDPETPPKPSEESKYGDLTEKEHTIENLVQSYADRNIERYAELLCADYLWFMQPRDVQPGGQDFYAREEDITMTRNMFLAAMGQYTPAIDKLELAIDAGDWYSVSTIGDKDCEDGECWATERDYHITVQVGETTYIANELVMIQIARDSATGKFCIMRIYDIEK